MSKTLDQMTSSELKEWCKEIDWDKERENEKLPDWYEYLILSLYGLQLGRSVD